MELLGCPFYLEVVNYVVPCGIHYHYFSPMTGLDRVKSVHTECHVTFALVLLPTTFLLFCRSRGDRSAVNFIVFGLLPPQNTDFVKYFSILLVKMSFSAN